MIHRALEENIRPLLGGNLVYTINKNYVGTQTQILQDNHRILFCLRGRNEVKVVLSEVDDSYLAKPF